MNRILKTLLATEGLWMLSVGLFGPIYAIFVAKIGGDVLEAGGAYAAFSLAAGFMVFFISRWEEHVKHKEKLIVLGHAIGAAGILGYLFVANPIHLFIVQIMLGLAEAIGSPAFDGIYSKNLDKGRFISEWGMYDSMDYFVTGISAAIGGVIASIYGFQVLFTIMFLLSLVSLAISVKLHYLNS
jgi:hypothetical protein